MKMSQKAQIVLRILEELGATDLEHKANIYDIMEKLDKTNLQEWYPKESKDTLFSIKIEMTQKSISTTIAALIRGGKVAKTNPEATKVGTLMRNLRSYYLK